MEIHQIIGNLSNVIGYVYENKKYIIFNPKHNFNKSYALVSYNIINNYGYHNESLLQVISFITNLHINEYNELNYEIDNYKRENDTLSKINYTKNLYINDSCNLCTFVKKKYNLENIFEYPQFIIEYTIHEENHIQELFHNLFINREISKSNLQEINKIKYQIAQLENELHKIQNEEDKNKLEDYMKKEYFMKSKL